MPRRLLPLLIAVLLSGCAGGGHLAPRAGYVVDYTHASPSHSSRVHHLVLHYTDENEVASLAVLTGPDVSAHYLLPARPQSGELRVYQLVDESRRAWHAGTSAWKQRSHLNDTSLGIEIVNAGPERTYAEIAQRLAQNPEAADEITWAPYSESQVETLIALSRDIIARHGIHPTDVVAHSDIAPERKIDPGPAFPWRRLHEAGIGAWPEDTAVARWQARFATASPPLARLQAALQAWGYALEVTGERDPRTRAVLRAFQMHFRPADYHGLPDIESAAILWALLERYRPEALAGLR